MVNPPKRSVTDMNPSLEEIIRTVRDYAGIVRKRPIRNVFDRLRQTHEYGSPLPSFGDDAAVIPWDDRYLLVAADGMMTGLLVNEPYAAGKASVMVTVNDIFAMGGRPMGLVNVLASGEENQRRLIVEGIAKGCRKMRVPMLGGHLHPDSPAEQPALSVTIVGEARSLLRSHLAESGDDLILAVDLTGRAGCKSVVSWDANSGKSPEELRRRLDALPITAETGLACAAKDVSNGGILGTAAIMMENSSRGAEISLAAVPRPDGMSLSQWLLCFQSYGFILSCPLANTPRILALFREREVTAAVIGRVTARRSVRVAAGGAEGVLFDFDREFITGIHRPG